MTVPHFLNERLFANNLMVGNRQKMKAYQALKYQPIDIVYLCQRR